MYCPTGENRADGFTKHVPCRTLWSIYGGLGVRSGALVRDSEDDIVDDFDDGLSYLCFNIMSEK